MNQLMRQVLTREALMNNPIALAQIIINDVTTNVGLTDALRYLPYIGNLHIDGISTYTMPGVPANRNGISFFIPDSELLPGVINQVFYYMPGEEEYEDATDAEYDEEQDAEYTTEYSTDYPT